MKKLFLAALAATSFTYVQPAANAVERAPLEDIQYSGQNLLETEMCAGLLAKTLAGYKKNAFDAVPTERVNQVLAGLNANKMKDFFTGDFTYEIANLTFGTQEFCAIDEKCLYMLKHINKSLLSDVQLAQVQSAMSGYTSGVRHEFSNLPRHKKLDGLMRVELPGHNTVIASDTIGIQFVELLEFESLHEKIFGYFEKAYGPLSSEVKESLIQFAQEQSFRFQLAQDALCELYDPHVEGNEILQSFFHFPPAHDDSEECKFLLKSLLIKMFDSVRKKMTAQEHPIAIAAYIYVTFVMIHPYPDGNGRTARLLTNMLLMQHGLQPFPFHMTNEPIEILRNYLITEQDQMIRDLEQCFYTYYISQA